MAQLEIRIAENWSPVTHETPGSETSFAWLLRGSDGTTTRTGKGALDALPAAATCRIVVPAGRVLLSSVQLPAQNRKKFMQALPYAVEDRIMADPESVHVAAGEVQENGEMPVAIVDRAWLSQLLESLRGKGLKPDRVEVETLLAPFAADSWTLVWQGNGGFLRQGRYGGIPLDGGDAERPPAALQLAMASAGQPPGSIRVFLDGAEAPNLAAWSSGLGIPVTSAGEWHWPAAEERGINLLQSEFAPRSTRAEWLPRLRPALRLAALILCLQVAFTAGDWAMLKFEKYRLTSAMEKSFHKAFPDARAIVDAPLQMRRNLAELRHEAGIVGQNDFLPLLARIAPNLGAEARLRSLDYQQETLKIRLTLPNQAAVEQLRAKLPEAGFAPGNSGPGGIEVELTIGKQA